MAWEPVMDPSSRLTHLPPAGACTSAQQATGLLRTCCHLESRAPARLAHLLLALVICLIPHAAVLAGARVLCPTDEGNRATGARL